MLQNKLTMRDSVIVNRSEPQTYSNYNEMAIKACKKNTHIEQNDFHLKYNLCDVWLFTYCSILLSCSDTLTNEVWYEYES